MTVGLDDRSTEGQKYKVIFPGISVCSQTRRICNNRLDISNILYGNSPMLAEVRAIILATFLSVTYATNN